MNGRISSHSIAVLLVLTCLAGLLSQSPAYAQPSSSPYQLLWFEDFGSSNLDTRWNWVRENPTYWSLTDRPGYMRITAQNGGLFGPGGTQENLLLTSGYSEDFLVTTKIDFAPTQNFEIAGLLIFQDEDNYLYLGRSYANGNQVRFRNEIGGSTQTIVIDETATSLYLRIRRESSVYFAHYSLDGINWIFVGNHNNNLSNPQLVLYQCRFDG